MHSRRAQLPGYSDWIDVGLVLDTGEVGSWDTIMEGTTPSAVVRRDGTWLLYYVGARDYIARPDNIGPARRSIGVATSTDGIRWSKPKSDPVITHAVSGNPEEGAVSAGITLADGGSVLAYYGANTSADSTTNEVRADVRLAVSGDGMHFEPVGTVIDHRDPRVWGHGDELHATLALSHAENLYVFYVPNGSPQRGRLGYGRLRDHVTLDATGPVLSAGAPVDARGPASAVRLGPDEFAVFVSDRGTLDAYVVTAEDPREFGPVVASYEIGSNAIVALDNDHLTWMLYYDRWTHIGLKVAPAGTPDRTPPNAPATLQAHALAHDRVALRWSAATDAQTGVLLYHVYRDATRIGRSFDLATTDSSCRAGSAHDYEVRAVNFHGAEGPGVRAVITTPVAPQRSTRTDPTGPVALWDLNDKARLGADTSGWAHHAVVVGAPEPISGLHGGAIELDGSDYLERAPTPVLDRAFAGSFTLVATVRPATAPPQTDASDDAFAIFTGPNGVGLRYRADCSFVATIGAGETGLELASEPFDPGTWYRVAMVVDAPARTLALYVNGDAVPRSPVGWQGSRPGLRFESSSHARYRARYRIGVASPRFALQRHAYRGAIDEVIVYGRTLTHTELQAPR